MPTIDDLFDLAIQARTATGIDYIIIDGAHRHHDGKPGTYAIAIRNDCGRHYERFDYTWNVAYHQPATIAHRLRKIINESVPSPEVYA